jgi:glycerol-3-phosphate dehydrogenase
LRRPINTTTGAGTNQGGYKTCPYSRLRLLFERYGTRLEEIADYLAAGNDQPLQYQPEYSQREVAYLARQEKVVHLDDLILRRTLLGMLGQVTAGLVVELAEVVGEALNWPPERQQAEIRRTSVFTSSSSASSYSDGAGWL